MNAALEREVRRRAREQCEYCLIPQSADITPHQIEHVIARKHGGETTSDNLALACLNCNSHKGPNIAGLDPESRSLTRLFHPRTDSWDQNFRLERNGVIVGTTAVGRTTVIVLNMNEPNAVTLRGLLILEGTLTPAI